MTFPCVLVILLLAASASAKSCIETMIPTLINARQAIFDQIALTDNWAAAQFSLNFTSIRDGGNYTEQVVAGYQTVTGEYNISAIFCHPNAGIPLNATVQLLVHGIGFDKSYWDLPALYPGISSSYVDTAVDKYNFCTLSIDRFGIAGSYTPGMDPINLVQAPATMSSIYAITQQLRAGTLPNVPVKFKKVVHVGHSFGAFLSYFLVTMYPDASDGLVLTGFTFSGTWFSRTIAGWNLHLASLNQPLRFGNVRLYGSSPPPSYFSRILGPSASQALSDLPSFLTTLISTAFSSISGLTDTTTYQDIATTEVLNLINGYNYTTSNTSTPLSSSLAQNLPPSYLTWPDVTAGIYAFLYPPTITAAVALYSEKTKQPTTPGELFTIGNAPPTAHNYTAPVLMISGQQDNIYCGGDCTMAGWGTSPGSNLLAAGRKAFPDVVGGRFQSRVVGGMGHGMNFHATAPGYFVAVQEFLVAQGLGRCE